MVGKIELIIGPMYASKSSELIRIANRYKCINKQIIAVNHKLNDRYGTNEISTHDQLVLSDCIITDNLSSLRSLPNYEEIDIIIIEELQFFNDAYEFIINAADNDGKIIIAAGLSGDCKRKEFGDVLRLIPHAEKIIHLSALCKICGDGTPAYFTKLIKEDLVFDQITIGSTDKFEAVCRFHYSH